MGERKDLQAYPQTNLSNQLLQHHQQMLQFLFFTNYDIIYETFQLKHASYSDRNRGRIAQTFKSQEIAKHFQLMSQKMHIRILRDDIDLDKQLQKLEILWHSRNIPYFHRYYFLKFLITCYFKNIQPSITKEEGLIRSEQHIYYTLFKSINAREACLRNLKKQLADLTAQDVYEYLHTAKERLFNQKRKNQRQKYRSQGYKLKLVQQTYEGKMSKTKFQLFSDGFNHLTKLTLYVIELIVKWKEYIGSITHDARKQKQRMEYYFFDDNYYLKILTDLGFLRVSFLQQFYQFAPKNDPFLLQCVLAFEKKKQKTIEQELLKLIFMPQKEHLAEIMAKMELLSEEYRYNIRSRKVFDLNVLKKPALRAEEKQFNNEAKQQISNLVLKKIESPPIQKKSKSVSTFRVRQTSGSAIKKQKIVVEFKSSPRKKITSIPATVEKQLVDFDKDNPLKNSVLLQKNENAIKMNAVDINLLSTLKQQIIRKVREQFLQSKGGKMQESQALQLFIDTKVKQTIKSIFPFEPEKQLKLPLQFTPISISDIDLSSQVQAMFKRSIPEYQDMQLSQVQLVKVLEETEYLYILVGRIGDQQIGRVICALDKGISQFKVLKILYLHFLDLSEIDMLIIKFAEFLWKYENSFEVHYNFFQPANHEPIKQLIQGLEKTLEKQCLFGRKQLYSTVMEIKLIFKRQAKNVNYIPNRFPFSLHLDFKLLLAQKKLMLENRNEHKNLELVNYDYFLMHGIKKCLSSQDILTLKERVSWKNRLKLLVQMLKEEEEGDFMLNRIHYLESSNVSEMNNILAKIHYPFLELSDLVKSNSLTLLSTSFTLTPAFPIKVCSRNSHQKYYRISIMGRFTIEIDSSGTEFFLLPTKESSDYYLLVFNARQYLTQNKQNEVYLSEYLTERITKRQHGIKSSDKVVNCIWVPMVRYPHKFKERQEVFIHTTRTLDLASLKIDVLLGEKLEMFCSMEMNNSIKFQATERDIILDCPLAVGIVSSKTRTVLYTRVFH